MRVQATATAVSWIPSESVTGALRAGFDLRLSHYDSPPPARLSSPDEVRRLRDADGFRFANVLGVWADVDDDGVHDVGISPSSGLAMGATTTRLAGLAIRFAAVSLPVLRHEPEVLGSGVRVVQTVGGRTGVPLPRPVPHPPFVQWSAPTVWTTLAVTLRPDGTSDVELLGASAFPRHWVYGPDGTLVAKSGLTDPDGWLKHSFGERTPWSSSDSSVLVAEAESALERELSALIMRGGAEPEIRRVGAGAAVMRQGEPGDELFLVLDGVLDVAVDSTIVAEVGPGAVIGERALLEGGRRTATVRARTPARLAVAGADAVDLDRLRELAAGHQREIGATPVA
ncbi:putative transcriptional regulator, Crp/Fnr family [Beutenbergia cavernae DSM 12333]|uniref:Putative transcriptional regulator, Crp/Fnr family n=1 Tax=Beutenbergia cavernae (strain ATCC BAA-8 / DSM 12333 / CCUG 43141 / JCM 11478 / NBRC 16432 / NCIMB 13614 / HKI 0122) TaxID=471853 RepID=C5BWJ2_BEUC1|nr:cyclic nucleotide-binding domain-containing protein [Beutenbergia cavernae]ACQ78650.1 putative transcriptional regulator, Crp/Fnr family [Beutenbergia cavernae DSM 12333]